MKIPFQPYSYPGMTLDELLAKCGYVPPPADLALPEDYRDDRDGAAYRRLFEHFQDEAGGDYSGAYDRMTCHLAVEYGLELEDAESLLWDFDGNMEIKYN